MTKLVSDTLFVAAAGAINRSKGIVLIPVIVAAIGMEGYGAFVQIFAVVRLVGGLSSLELGMGFQRFASGIPASERTRLGRHFCSVLAPMSLLAALGAFAMYKAAPTLSGLLFEQQHLASLQLACIVVFSNSCFSLSRHFLRAQRLFKLESTLDLSYQLAPYLGLVAGVILAGNLQQGVLAYVAIDLAVAGVAFVFASRGIAWCAPSIRLATQYVRYSAPLALSTVQGGLLARADLFFISYFLGLHAVGIYNVVYRVTEIISFVDGPIQVQFLSYLSRPWDEGRVEDAKRVLRDALLAFVLVTAGLLLCMVVYMDPLFELVLDDPGQTLWPVVLLIGGGMMANSFRRFLYVLIRLHRATLHELGFQAAALAVNVLANLLLIPRFGLGGAAFATLLAYASILPFVVTRYPLGLDRAFLWHVLAFFAMAMVVTPIRYLLPPEDLGSLVLSGAAAYAAYLGLIALLRWQLLVRLWRDLAEGR